MTEIEQTNSGVRLEGSWEEVSEVCVELEDLLEEYVCDEKEIERLDEWRPRGGEDEKEIEEKTAKEAAVGQKRVEEEFKGTKEELKDAEDKIKRSFNDIANRESPVKDMEVALKDLEILIGAKSVGSLRKAEEVIYKKLMLKFNPCYFDTEDFSIGLDHKKGDQYVFSVNISDEDLRDHVQEELGP
ncbi:MAG: DUF5828 family protein [Candidatus Natronoplasma sp.]